MRLFISTCLLILTPALLWTSIGDPCYCVCGDVNGDEVVNVSDAVYLLNSIFRNGPPPPSPEGADANYDGDINIGDIVFIVNYVFRSGPAPECEDAPASCSVIITDLPADSIQLDPHNLESIDIDGNIINILTAYGGGCRRHYFWLYMSPACFLESYPVQANLHLRHHANGDDCEAFIMDSLSFNLLPVGELYISMYGQTDSIIINVFEYFEDEPAGKLSAMYYPDLSQ